MQPTNIRTASIGKIREIPKKLNLLCCQLLGCDNSLPLGARSDVKYCSKEHRQAASRNPLKLLRRGKDVVEPHTSDIADGQFVTMMQLVQVEPEKMFKPSKTVARPVTVWVGNNSAPKYNKKDIGKPFLRPDVQPHHVHHVIDHNDRPEVKEPVPLNCFRNNVHGRHDTQSGRRKFKRPTPHATH